MWDYNPFCQICDLASCEKRLTKTAIRGFLLFLNSDLRKRRVVYLNSVYPDTQRTTGQKWRSWFTAVCFETQIIVIATVFETHFQKSIYSCFWQNYHVTVSGKWEKEMFVIILHLKQLFDMRGVCLAVRLVLMMHYGSLGYGARQDFHASLLT